MSLLPLLAAAALAQAVPTDRPGVPSAGLATENGPAALWVNPANLAYDPDPRFGVLVNAAPGGPTGLAATWGTRGVGLGVYNRFLPDGTTDWSLDYATGIPLPRRLAVGFRLDWHLIEGGRNFVGWDVGASWRPLPWVGASAVAYNIGTPHPDAVARSGGGLAIRPFGDALVLGADYLRAFPVQSTDPEFPDDLVSDVPEELVRATARLRPVEGLYLRASIDSEYRVAAGVEVYFGGFGGGLHAAQPREGARGYTGWLGTDEPGESLVRSGRRVPTVDLRDMPPYQPASGLFLEERPGWLDTLRELRRVEGDPTVRGVAITLGSSRTSWARYQELRARITSLEQAGKKVVVYLYGRPDTGAYFAASAAGHVVLHPAATLDLRGLAVELVHAGEMLDLVGVEAQFVRRSEYKTFSEPLTASEPSPEELEQTRALLDDTFAEIVAGISAGREVPRDQVRAWIDAGPWSPERALEQGLVDDLAYPDQAEARLHEHHGVEVRIRRLEERPRPHSPWTSPSRIAVIYVEGPIVTGRSSPGGLLNGPVTGSRTVATHLARARTDAQVKAVVLRVDSPGGSAFASDAIWREVERVRLAGKPVVVSMGGVATSGGYYLAAGADAIWAEPTTITGSIGVVAGKFAIDELLDRIGVHTTTLSRGRVAALESLTHGWDPVERARMEAQVEATYQRFLGKVAAGRSMSVDEVDAVARGRVWSGRAALDHGLVDGLGGFEEALADARRRAGLSGRVELVTWSEPGVRLGALSPALLHASGPLPEIAGALRPAASPALVPPELAPLRDRLSLWARLGDGSAWMIEPRLLEVEPR